MPGPCLFRSSCTRATIVALVLCARAHDHGDGPSIEQLDMEDSSLAVKGSGIEHKYGCANSQRWQGSCDIDENGKVLHKADWSVNCDPWGAKTWANATDNAEVTFTHGNWTCPEEHRSPSGCGDFRTDPRNLTCDAALSLNHDPTCYERVLIEVSEPLIPQKHVCVQHPIFYDNYNTAGSVTPPIVGRHREHWPKWGEYEYIPPQRWLHGLEHGGVIFLYHHCLDERSLCSIRTFIRKWQMKVERGELEGGQFRFILTPARYLQRNFAMVTWGEVYMSACFNENEMDMFLINHYRRAWEDFDKDGKYDYLWIGLKNNTSCSLEVAAARPSAMMQKWESGTATDASELIQLRSEQRTLRWLTAAALGASVFSLVILAAMMCRVLPLVKHRSTSYLEHSADDSHSDIVDSP